MAEEESGWLQWIILLALTALALSLVVIAQILTTYSAAYMSGPAEIATFLDTVDFSIQENESHDRDIAKVQNLGDKIRLGRLLREIQKTGDDLREDLNAMLLDEDSTSLRTSARFLWAAKRAKLEDRVRRLDLLRMRFLVVYMGVITANIQKQQQQQPTQTPLSPPPPPPPPLPTSRDIEKAAALSTPTKPALKKSYTDGPGGKRAPPLRRLTTQAIGHSASTGRPHRRGWAGVVEELQMSPRMHQRHASIEQAMAMEKTPPSA